MHVRWGRVFLVLALLALFGCGVAYYVLGPAAGGILQTVKQFETTSSPAQVPAEATREAAGGAPPAATHVPGASGPGAAPASDSNLPPFRVLSLAYTPYMATLALMDARRYMEGEGYDLQLVDAYNEAVNLDEEGQCKAVQSGQYNALATTLDATRKCGTGVAIGVPIGQSAGNDAIVVKPGIETWNDVFEHTVAFTGYSVSEYMACFASHSANQPIQAPLRYDDAAKAVDAWINSGAEQNISSVVAWQPEIERALKAVPGSRVILSSKDVRILWDVVEFASQLAAADPKPYTAFTRAYYRALNDLSTDPEGAYNAIQAWAGDDAARKGLLSAESAEDFKAQLSNEAFATLRDAAVVMDERHTILNRLEEAGFYWKYCNVAVPDVPDLSVLIAPDFVLETRKDASLVGNPNDRPGGEVFQVTDFTNAAAVTDAQIEKARVLFQAGVNIEFMPNRTDFRDPAAANTTLENAVRFLRTCQDCVLEVQGGAAYPGERVCPGCRPEESDKLAVDRGRRVSDTLKLQFDVPEAQLRFVDQPRKPQYPKSNNEEELRQDRRTFLTGYQLSGR